MTEGKSSYADDCWHLKHCGSWRHAAGKWWFDGGGVMNKLIPPVEKKKEVVSVWKAVRFLTALWPVFVLTPLWDKSCCGSYAMGLVWLSFGLSEWLFFAWPQVFFHLPATSPGPARAYTPGRPHHELHRWGWKKSRLDAIEDHKENHTAIAFV